MTKTPWYFGDGAALLLLFSVLIATGCFLALTYSPSPETAYGSVVQITLKNRLGWLLRALHYWSAGAMVVLLVVHVLRQFLLGGYLPPREALWLIGVGLFFLIWINAFTGYTLRWDDRGIYAIRVALNLFYQVPFIGEELVLFIQGGWTLGAETLSRFYAVHVLFVPLSILMLSSYHLYLVVIHGVTTQAERELEPTVSTAEEQKALHEALKTSPRHGADFHPEASSKSGAYALAVLAVVIALALTLGPPRLGPKANLVEASFPKEEWWLHWYSAMAALLPPSIAPLVYVALPLLLFALMVALPFIDRGMNRGLLRRPLAATAGTVLVFGLFSLTDLRIRSPWTAWPIKELPPLPPGTKLTRAAEQGRALFSRYGCNTCHAVGGHGSRFGPNLTGTDPRLSRDELIRYISKPPEGVPMPAYQGRIGEEHLRRIVDFVLVAQTFPKSYAPAIRGRE